MPSPRDIPSVEKLLQRSALTTAAAVHGRDRVADAVRAVAAKLREQLSHEQDASLQPDVDVSAWIEDEAVAHLEREVAPSLRPVINATGVIIHTNLGRAPLSASARYQATATAAGYAN